jgi:tRNA (adenine-N(1)-)-methyltransferase non-catalytic subunit
MQSNVRWKRNLFKITELIGQKFHSYFELDRQKLVPLDLKTLINDSNEENSESSEEEEKNEAEQENLEEKDNRNIFDGNNAQKLNTEEIMKFKGDGGSVVGLIEKLKENSKTFQKKTTFAQEKYIKKKKTKYLFNDVFFLVIFLLLRHMFYFCLKKVSLEAMVQMHYSEGPLKIK